MGAARKKHLSITDLAEELQVPVRTIYYWRAQRPPKGPRGFTVGKHVRYRREDVDAWIESLLE